MNEKALQHLEHVNIKEALSEHAVSRKAADHRAASFNGDVRRTAKQDETVEAKFLLREAKHPLMNRPMVPLIFVIGRRYRVRDDRRPQKTRGDRPQAHTERYHRDQIVGVIR